MSRLPLVMGIMLMTLMLSSCGQHRGVNFATTATEITESQSQSQTEYSIVKNWSINDGKQIGGYEIFLTDSNRQILPPDFSVELSNNGLLVNLESSSVIRGVFVRWQLDVKPIKSVNCSENVLLEYVSPHDYAVAGVLKGESSIIFDNQNSTPERNLNAIRSGVDTLNVFNTGRSNEYLLFWMQRLAGDCNNNNEVDFADFGTISANYKLSVPNIGGLRINPLDPSGNGVVDFTDFGIVGSNYGQKLSGYRVYATTSSKTLQSVANVYQPVTDLLNSWQYNHDYFMQIVNLPDGLSTPLYVAPIFNNGTGSFSPATEPINSVWLPSVMGGTTLNAEAQLQRKVSLSWSVIQVPDFTNDGVIDNLDFAEIDKAVLSSSSSIPLAGDYLKRFIGKNGQDAFMDYHSIFSQIGKQPRAGVLPDLYRVLATIYKDRPIWSTNIYRFGPDPFVGIPMCKRIGQTYTNSYEDIAPSEGDARYLIMPEPITDLFTYVQNQYLSALPVKIRIY